MLRGGCLRGMTALRRGLHPRISIACSLAVALFARGATAAPPSPSPSTSKTVVVAGPQDDAIATRLQKELTALGYETVRLGALDTCARQAIITATNESSAIAATCSDGDQVGVWIVDSQGTLRLRDVVVAREEGERARETTAVRAAEITRATLSLREAEDEAARRSPPPAQEPPPAPVKWETYDRGAGASKNPAAPVREGRAPLLVIGGGISSLLGVDATVIAFSGQVELRLLKNMALAARLEMPAESSTISNAANIQVAPGLAGAGVDFPLRDPTSFIIPRFGGGVGGVWFRAQRPAGPNSRGVLLSEGSDTAASFAMYGDAALSMRIVGALRITVDGILGTTTSRLVARNEGQAIAYWGQPFGTLALRLELMFP